MRPWGRFLSLQEGRSDGCIKKKKTKNQTTELLLKKTKHKPRKKLLAKS